MLLFVLLHVVELSAIVLLAYSKCGHRWRRSGASRTCQVCDRASSRPSAQRGSPLMTRIFFDTEFMEDGEVILPLSLGFVAETGQRLYLVIDDADESKANAWVQENVLPYLRWADAQKATPGWDCDRDTYAEVPRVMAGAYVAEWIEQVCPIEVERSPYPTPEFWADYGGYDYVLLNQLFGPMSARPLGWPMFCMDIQQLKRHVGFEGALPEPRGRAHCAMDDALNCQRRWELLTEWDLEQIREHEEAWASSRGGIEDDGVDPAGTVPR